MDHIGIVADITCPPQGCATVISSHFVTTTNVIAGLSLVWSIVQATAVVLTLTVMLLLRDILLEYGTVL